MHIVKREMRAHLKSLLIWSAVMLGLIAMIMVEFKAYYNNPEMSDVLNMMPEAMLKAFSMENANLTTLGGFVSLISFYLFVMGGVYAVLLGSNIISKEERDKTAEFFMTLPISRTQIITSKLVAAILNSFLLVLATGLSIVITSWKYSPDRDFYRFLALYLIAMFILCLIFLSVGMLLSSVLKRYKSSGKISAAILFVLYMINIVSALSKNLDFLKYITPFKYFDTNAMLIQGEIDIVYVLISFAIIAFCIAGTYVVYPKRDLHI
ncbi:ABC transporter permease subunit [Alkalibacter mobilis]|uniref:ABC transporter permease subunit n=1 Tax=Alkalibacter mobilis TaxID=2787712 RepID=UPI00189D1D8D|nr:ABC transporter permease subunit [Alkalibacter mobilis]MBF7097281.1 ABC transporter permease [Alkalibacter mobilis]